jgi:alanine dehydrogenase
MKIGVPKEIKVYEYRVGLVPASVRELAAAGHDVLVERTAGHGIGVTDADYEGAGARMVESAAAVFAEAELIVKVKEPQPDECAMLRPGQILFAYLHLAADRPQAEALCRSGATAMAYETVTADDGSLPLLTPMSEVAGRMSIQVGANYLQWFNGGAGVLLGGVPGVEPGRVVILGGGVAGSNAAAMALGLQANVTVVDRSVPRLRQLATQFGRLLKTVHATADRIDSLVTGADLVVGAVLIPGASAPRLVSRGILKRMKPGTVLVDISIDQGGCFETSRPTTHAEPTYIIDDVVHYCVTNMPGAVPRTSTYALNNVTLPFVMALANQGLEAAVRANPHLKAGINVHRGKIQHEVVARALHPA